MQQEARQSLAGQGQTNEQGQGQQVVLLTSKLNAQADRIIKWKMHTEMELKKRDEKIKDFESTIHRQHSNMLNQQLQCEKLSQRLQAELLNRGELKGKIDNTRQICSLLQNHCNQLSGTLQRCINEKEVLKTVYDDQMKEIDDLAQKYTRLNEQYIGDVEQLKSMVAEERQGRVKNVKDAKALKATMELRLEAIGKLLKNERERAEQLSTQLAKSEEAIQQLSKERESYREQLELVKTQLKEVESTLTAEKLQLKEGLELTEISLAEEKKRVETLKLQSEEILANLQDVVKTKEEALEDNNKKQNMLEKLTTELEEKEGEVQHNRELVAGLRTDKQALEEQVSGLEQLRSEFSQLQISLEQTTKEKAAESEQLGVALKELQQLHQAICHNEQLIEKCDQERLSSDQQVLRLEDANAELDSKLVQAKALICTMTSNVEQLKGDLDIKRGEIQNLRSSLDSLTVTSEIELKEKLEDVNNMNISNTELKNQIDILNNRIEELTKKSGLLQCEAEELRVSLVQEEERGRLASSGLAECEQQLAQVQAQLNERQLNQAQTAASLATTNQDKQQLQGRIDTLLQQMAKLSTDKNQALSEAACTLRDKKTIEIQTETKLQESLQELEKFKVECDKLVQQHNTEIKAQQLQLKELQESKDAAEEKLVHTEKQLNDTLCKMKALAEKNESKKQRLQEKVGQLEKKLRGKDTELKDLKTSVSPRVASADSPQASQPRHGIITGIPTTPKILSAEPARSILKTPTTPMTRKRVMFQDESSDTDASAVDILVIDEKEVHRRLEAMKRGDKTCNVAPMPVVKSPKLGHSITAKRRELTDKDKALKEMPAPAPKKSRFAGDELPKATRLFNKDTQSKTKNYPDDFDNAFGFED